MPPNAEAPKSRTLQSEQSDRGDPLAAFSTAMRFEASRTALKRKVADADHSRRKPQPFYA
jgi:hypothetical protein